MLQLKVIKRSAEQLKALPKSYTGDLLPGMDVLDDQKVDALPPGFQLTYLEVTEKQVFDKLVEVWRVWGLGFRKSLRWDRKRLQWV